MPSSPTLHTQRLQMCTLLSPCSLPQPRSIPTPQPPHTKMCTLALPMSHDCSVQNIWSSKLTTAAPSFPALLKNVRMQTAWLQNVNCTPESLPSTAFQGRVGDITYVRHMLARALSQFTSSWWTMHVKHFNGSDNKQFKAYIHNEPFALLWAATRIAWCGEDQQNARNNPNIKPVTS